MDESENRRKEDKEQLDFCCAAIEMSDFSNVDYRTQAVSWLESLRPQSHWKPSEEQIRVLEDMIEACEKQFSHREDGGRYLLKQLKEL